MQVSYVFYHHTEDLIRKLCQHAIILNKVNGKLQPPIIATANHEWKMTRFEFWTWNDFVILDFEVKEGVFSFTYYSVKFR